jgi:glycerophosphoryl diester phosphodiesterase
MDWFSTRSSPLLIAHRGASADAPENTLTAFQLALAQGADGLELDVQLTADERVVVIHDGSLERTTSGHGRVRDLTLAQVQQAVTSDGEPVPTLRAVFDTCGSQTRYNIELKEFGWRSSGLETAVGTLIKQHNLASNCLISSFNPFLLRRARATMPSQTPLALLRTTGLLQYTHYLFSGQADHPQASLVNADYMRWAKQRGYRVHVWTVDEPAEAEQLVQLGVQALITNKPAFLRSALRL